MNASGGQTTYENRNLQTKEFEIEFERLKCKIDNLRSQNEVLQLTLNESKAHSDRMTVLIGKYESNSTALQLALEYADQALRCSEVLNVLLESEKRVLLMNCKAAGIGTLGKSYLDCFRLMLETFDHFPTDTLEDFN